MSSITTDEDTDHWIDLDSNFANVPTQTLEEILAEVSNNNEIIDEDLLFVEEDDSFGLGKQGSAAVNLSYQLDCPLELKKDDAISHQIALVKDRPVGGKATVLSVSEQYLAVGTLRGMAIVFDRNTGRLLRFMNNDNGFPVAALSFSPDAVKLAVAYSNGALAIFKLSTGKLMDFRETVVQPDHGILQVQFVNKSTLLLIDSGGSVFQYREKRNGPARCIFTGCRGEAVHLQSIKASHLLLLCTLQQVLIFDEHSGKVVTQLRLPTCGNGPPLIDWHIQTLPITDKLNTFITRICIARGHEVRVYEVKVDKHSFTCPLVKVIKLDSNAVLCNLYWIDDQHFVVYDNKEKMHLVDALKGSVIDKIDLNKVKLVFNSAEFKGLYTGGNVSEALQYMAPNACYQTIKCQNGQIYLLGQEGVYYVQLLDQNCQLELFEKRDDIASALLFAADIYSGKIVDRTKDKRLKSRISNSLPRLLQQLLDYCMDGLLNGKVSELVEHYRKHIAVLIRVCVLTDNYDILYDSIYRRLERDSIAKPIFFDFLEEYLLEDRLHLLPPSLVHDYLSYLNNECQYSLFESAVTHIPIETLDLHQVITTCRTNKLFDGIIYVMNTAFKDYVGPLDEMCSYMAEFVPKTVFSDFEIAQGNRLLLYLSSCLAGKRYPFGDLESDLMEVVPLESYKFMVALNNTKVSSLTNYTRYPILRLLLDFDAHQFLNVISTCADASLFEASNGRLKRLVEILIGLSEEHVEYSFLLLPFVTQLVQTSVISQASHTFENLILSVINTLTTSSMSEASVQQKIVDLMRVCRDIPEDGVLRLARKRPLVIVCAYIYTKRREFVNLLILCLEDKHHPEGVFDIIKDLLDEVELVDQEQIHTFIKSSMKRLIAVDSMKTAKLFLEYFPEFLISSENLPFDLILSCFQLRREGGFKTLCEDRDVDEHLFKQLFKGFIEQNKNKTSPEVDHDLADLLRYWLPTGSRDDTCLNLATSSHLLECTVMLLVARGHHQRAFDTLFDTLKVGDVDVNTKRKRITLLLDLCDQQQELSKKKGWRLQLFYFVLDTHTKSDSFDPLLSQCLAQIVEKCGDQAAEVMNALFSHLSFHNATYSTFQPLLTETLWSCRLDEQILGHTLNCIVFENLNFLNKLSLSSSAPHAPVINTNVCVYCGNDLARSFLVFSCGHLAHADCADAQDRKCKCLEGKVKLPEIPQVLLCPPKSEYSMFHPENLALKTAPDPEDPF